MQRQHLFPALYCIVLCACQPSEQAPGQSSAPTPANSADPSEFYQQGLKYQTVRYDSALLYFEQAGTAFHSLPNENRRAEDWKTFINSQAELARGYALKGRFEAAAGLLDSTLLLAHTAALEDNSLLTPLLLSQYEVFAKWNTYHPTDSLPTMAGQSLERAENATSNAPLVQAELQYYLGKEALLRQQMDSAAYHWEEAERLLEKEEGVKMKALLCRILLAKAPISADADSVYREVVALNRENLVEPYSLIIAYNILSLFNYGDNTAFLNYCQKVYEINNQVFANEYLHTPRILKFLGIAYLNEGDHEKAELYTKEAIQCAKTLGFDNEIVGLQQNLAMVLSSQGKQQEAIDINLSNLELIRQLDPELESYGENYYSTLNNLGNLYRFEGAFEKSEEYNNRSLRTKLDILGEGHQYVAMSYFNLGQLYNDWEKYDKAETALRKALDIRARLGLENGVEISNNYYHFGLSQLQRGQYEPALQSFQRSIKALSPSFDETKAFAVPALDSPLISKIELLYPLSLKARVLQLQARQHQDSTLAQAAAAAFRSNAALADSIRLGFQSERSKSTLIEIAQPAYEWAIEHSQSAYSIFREEQYLNDAFFFVEKSKYALLQDALTASEAKFLTIPDSLREMEAGLKEKIASMEQEIFQARQNGEEGILDSLEAELLAARRDWNNLLERFEREYANYYALNNPETAELKAVKDYLKEQPGTMIVEYFLGDSTLLGMGISSGYISAFHWKIDSGIYTQIEELRAILHRYGGAAFQSDEKWAQDFQQYTALCHQLYKTLLAPLLGQPEETVNRLIIIPDGMLGYVPFEALLTEPVNDKDTDYKDLPYLIHQYDILYEYSATLLLQHGRQATQRADKLFVGFAPEYGDKGLIAESGSYYSDTEIEGAYPTLLRDGVSPLKYNQPEVRAIANALGGDEMAGSRATESAFKKMAEDYRILHLAMHAFVNDINPNFSHLVFTKEPDSLEDRFLHAFELYSIRLKAELAVLSACETGAGIIQKGEGIMSLSRAFKYAGCPNIVMSLWKANDKSTKDIMAAFYKNLQSGLDKSEALRQAKRSYLLEAESPAAAHPFNWATFILIGDASPLPIESGNGSTAYYLIAGLLIIGAGVFFYRRKKQ